MKDNALLPKRFRLKSALCATVAELLVFIANLCMGYQNYIFYIGYFSNMALTTLMCMMYALLIAFSSVAMDGRKLWTFPLILALPQAILMFIEAFLIYYQYYTISDCVAISFAAALLKYLIYIVLLYIVLSVFFAGKAQKCTPESFTSKKMFVKKDPVSILTLTVALIVMAYNLINEIINTYMFYDNYFGIYYLEDFIYIAFTYIMIILIAFLSLLVFSLAKGACFSKVFDRAQTSDNSGIKRP